MTPKTNTPEGRCPEPATNTSILKLGLDVHADSIVVVRQIDGALPQPAQKFRPPAFLAWVERQRGLFAKVYSCYEAGCFGYTLHRRLTALGVENVVVRPQDWDELGKGMKSDRADATALVTRLDRYVAGNRRSFCVVRVPSEDEERIRSKSRLRDQLRQHRQRAEAQGRTTLLYYAIRVKGAWWKPRAWATLRQRLPVWLIELVEPLRELALKFDAMVREHTARIESEGAKRGAVAKGVGALSVEMIRREVCDWTRFTNRRQVASFTGLCPRLRQSGARAQAGCINKHGNPKLRRVLIEAAWRIIRYQPGYHACVRWRTVLAGGAGAARKKAVVAIARHLAVDLWRIETGRREAQTLGLIA